MVLYESLIIMYHTRVWLCTTHMKVIVVVIAMAFVDMSRIPAPSPRERYVTMRMSPTGLYEYGSFT